MSVRASAPGPHRAPALPAPPHPGSLVWWRRNLLGAPIPTREADEARLSKKLALPVFSSDAISSVAYATQEILLALGAAGLAAVGSAHLYNVATWGVTGAIVLLLVIVATSYRQTIFAYSSGGGSYIVSKDNLGVSVGLIAAAALLIDYVLTVAVSIASGVQNLVSTPALARFAPETVWICVVLVGLLMLANLRGLREAGTVFAIPTYSFVGLAYLMIALGIFGPLVGWHLHANEVSPPPPDLGGAAADAGGSIGLVVLLRAFANGCSAMTGTEAISNGIPAFQKPESENAAKTLLAMAIILGTLFLGISYLATTLHIVYWEQDGKTAPAVIDQISGAVFGRSGGGIILYYAMQIATALILILAANTSFADFPRLASILANDDFLPRQLSHRGDRLVFSRGIIGLGIFAIILLFVFGGSVDRLIPLYALGVFTAFTLSQSGMVRHWFRERGAGWQLKAAINGIGAVATGIVFAIILYEKAPQGAWIVVVLAIAMLFLFRAIHRRYEKIRVAVALPTGEVPDIGGVPEEATDAPTPVLENHVMVLITAPTCATVPALRYARLLSPKAEAIYVEIDPERTEKIEDDWKKTFPTVPLHVLPSPYRSLVGPVLEYIDEVKLEEQANDAVETTPDPYGPDRLITVVIPEYFSTDMWYLLLQDTAAPMLKLGLLHRDDVVVTNVRYEINVK